MHHAQSVQACSRIVFAWRSLIIYFSAGKNSLTHYRYMHYIHDESRSIKQAANIEEKEVAFSKSSGILK
jgi:hypothetical protein